MAAGRDTYPTASVRVRPASCGVLDFCWDTHGCLPDRKITVGVTVLSWWTVLSGTVEPHRVGRGVDDCVGSLSGDAHSTQPVGDFSPPSSTTIRNDAAFDVFSQLVNRPVERLYSALLAEISPPSSQTAFIDNRS